MVACVKILDIFIIKRECTSESLNACLMTVEQRHSFLKMEGRVSFSVGSKLTIQSMVQMTDCIKDSEG